MEANLRIRSPQSTGGNVCRHEDGSGSSSVSVGSSAATLLPDPAVSGVEKEIIGAEGEKVSAPLINGEDGRFVLDSLPPWTHFFFSERAYRSLPVQGVIVPDQLEKQSASTAAARADCAVAGLVPSANVLSAAVSSPAPSKEVAEAKSSTVLRTNAAIGGPSALSSGHSAAHEQTTANSVCYDAATTAGLLSEGRDTCGTVHDSAAPCKTQAACSRAAIAETRATSAHFSEEDDADIYWHLLHDTLVTHGGVSGLQYFVSTDGSLGSHVASAGDACADGSVATPAEADTKMHTCTAAANGIETEDKGGPASNRHKSPFRELEAQQQNTGSWQPQDATSRLISEHQKDKSPDHLLTFCRVSRRVCGHKGVAHGGFIATLLDNAMGYLAQLLLPRAATKSLTINYLKPLLTETMILVEVRKVVDRATSSCAEGNTKKQVSRCSVHLATSERNASAADDTASKDSKDRERRKRSRTACCTIEGKVYTCIPEQLRATFPLKRDRDLAEGSQRDQEGISAQHGGSVSPQKRRTEQYGEGDRFIKRLDRSRDDGGDNRNMLREVNGVTAGSCASDEQRSNSFKPQETEQHTSRTDNSSEGDNAAHRTQSREAESLPPGVWLVATAQAVFVDVSAKWKALS